MTSRTPDNGGLCPSLRGVSTDTARLSPLARVLIIGDDESNLRIWEESLRDNCRTFFSAVGSSALTITREASPDLVILKTPRPDAAVRTIIKQIRSNDKTGQLRIVLLSNNGNHAKQRQDLWGADLFIPATTDFAVAVFKIRSLLKEQREQIMSRLMAGLDQLGREGRSDPATTVANRHAAVVSGEIAATCINLAEWVYSFRRRAHVAVPPCDGSIIVGNRPLLDAATISLIDMLERRAPRGLVTMGMESGKEWSDISLTGLHGVAFSRKDAKNAFTFYVGATAGQSVMAATLARDIILRHGGNLTCGNDPEGYPFFRAALPVQRPCAAPVPSCLGPDSNCASNNQQEAANG